jgi:hypothetical protein
MRELVGMRLDKKREERGKVTYKTMISDHFPTSIHEVKETGFLRLHGRAKNSFQATE